MATKCNTIPKTKRFSKLKHKKMDEALSGKCKGKGAGVALQKPDQVDLREGIIDKGSRLKTKHKTFRTVLKTLDRPDGGSTAGRGRSWKWERGQTLPECLL